ncbi:MAG TPA: phosphoribosylanthranilate isomerase [Bryobacteraceae bacterium]|nr:phosphoribosylanthranilate isomerase [Bryobacteraceae bacterium]
MFVKICGITNREDALAAVEAGAGAVGFVFYPRSPRCADLEIVKSWIDEIPANVWRVGVFVNESPARIEEIATDLALDVVQLHGEETPDNHPRNVRVWRAFRVNGHAIPRDYPAEALLLDGPGQGRTFDWNVARGFDGKVIVAGGLTPENVQAAVKATQPWGVDTASGVETKPGKKDHARMREFIKAALRS